MPDLLTAVAAKAKKQCHTATVHTLLCSQKQSSYGPTKVKQHPKQLQDNHAGAWTTYTATVHTLLCGTTSLKQNQMSSYQCHRNILHRNMCLRIKAVQSLQCQYPHKAVENPAQPDSQWQFTPCCSHAVGGGSHPAAARKRPYGDF